MKNLLIMGMVLLSTAVFAGNEKGNGGGIHLCEGQTTHEFYDIYEAQARYGYKIIDRKLSMDGYIQFALNKITKTNPYIGRKVKEQLDYLKDGHMIIRPKAKLTPVGDANILVTDEGCTYKQLANWDEVSGNLIAKKEYYDSMDALNKAAFRIHETLYKVGRDLDLLEKDKDGNSTSDDVRRMVGEIFSTNETLGTFWKYNLDKLIEEANERLKSFGSPKEKLDLSLKELKEFNVDLNNVNYCGNIEFFGAIRRAIEASIGYQVALEFIIRDTLSYAVRSEFQNTYYIVNDMQKKLDNEFYLAGKNCSR